MTNAAAEIYTTLLLLATLTACIWAFYRTRLPVTLAYGLYALIARVSVYPSQNLMRAIMEGKAGQNLGATVGERITAYSTINAVTGYTVQAIFLIWLIVSLALAAARDKSGTAGRTA